MRNLFDGNCSSTKGVSALFPLLPHAVHQSSDALQQAVSRVPYAVLNTHHVQFVILTNYVIGCLCLVYCIGEINALFIA